MVKSAGLKAWTPNLQAMGYIVSQRYFYKVDFVNKLPAKVDMPLNKETKPVQFCYSVHFQTFTLEKGMNLLIPHSYGLNCITAVLLQKSLWH